MAICRGSMVSPGALVVLLRDMWLGMSTGHLPGLSGELWCTRRVGELALLRNSRGQRLQRPHKRASRPQLSRGAVASLKCRAWCAEQPVGVDYLGHVGFSLAFATEFDRASGPVNV